MFGVTYQAALESLDGLACKFSDNMRIVTSSLTINLLDQAKSDTRLIQLANHGIPGYTQLASGFKAQHVQTHSR